MPSAFDMLCMIFAAGVIFGFGVRAADAMIEVFISVVSGLLATLIVIFGSAAKWLRKALTSTRRKQ